MTMTFTSLLATGWLSSGYVVWPLIILGAIVLVGLLVLLARKRWDLVVAMVRHPFAKYVFLSIAVHIGLAAWLVTSHFLDAEPLPSGSAVVMVDLGTDDVGTVDYSDEDKTEKPWEHPATESLAEPPPELPFKQTPRETPPPELPFEQQPVASPLADLESLVDAEQADSNPFPDMAEAAPLPSPITNELAVNTFEQPKTAKPLPSVNVTKSTDPSDSTDSSLDPAVRSPLEKQATRRETFEPNGQLAALTGEVDAPKTHPSSEAQFDADAELADLPSEPAKTANKRSRAPFPTLANRTKTQPVASSRSNQAMSRLGARRRADGRLAPAIYRDRWARDRLAIARVRGGSQDTEAAVAAALTWLSTAQGADGGWDASQYGSGQPVREGGHDRGNAGQFADTATTGLALLAFLGAGHTHQDGEHKETIQQGIQFLLRAQQQRTDGSLVGRATGYAAMYCHGIATLALSEAYSLSGDRQLRGAVNAAIQFTLSSQHPAGGWRYRPQEPGDTSQLGWQLMALTSAHYSDFAIPPRTWRRAGQFLMDVSSGRELGLAAYKPNGPPTRTMTAEAMLCRLFLGTSPAHPGVAEATDFLMSELPGQGRRNYYYWYYGTLSLYHLQNEDWRRWNRALTAELLSLQERNGTWPTNNSVWGNAGGTVYTTALAAMTLEVYYRYRPLTETRQIERTARRK